MSAVRSRELPPIMQGSANWPRQPAFQAGKCGFESRPLYQFCRGRLTVGPHVLSVDNAGSNPVLCTNRFKQIIYNGERSLNGKAPHCE